MRLSVNNPSLPLVSVAIPVYNAAQFLTEAIESVLSQTFDDFELILINDGSTDKSPEIMESYKDSRIRYINDNKNLGLIARLNQSIALAKGKYYARMDADDIMHPRRLEKQVAFFHENPGYTLVGTNYCLIDDKNTIFACGGMIPREPSVQDIVRNRAFLHPSVMAKTEWFRANNYSTLYPRIEDKELWLRCVGTIRWQNLDDKLMFYRAAGVPLLKKYIMTQKGNLRLTCHYRAKIGFINAIIELVKTFLKILVYSSCSMLSLTNFVVSLRAPSVENKESVESYLTRMEKKVSSEHTSQQLI